MRVVAIVAGLLCIFFVFYTVRLVAVTHGLQQVRATGHGAYIGAVIFPVLALVFAWASIRAWGATRRDSEPPGSA